MRANNAEIVQVQLVDMLTDMFCKCFRFTVTLRTACQVRACKQREARDLTRLKVLERREVRVVQFTSLLPQRFLESSSDGETTRRSNRVSINSTINKHLETGLITQAK